MPNSSGPKILSKKTPVKSQPMLKGTAKESAENTCEAVLLLEDGTLFRGEGFGGKGTVCGEVVFNTGMTGYQEILTDPSYKGQMVMMTCPHIGNYGINPEDMESSQPHVKGFIVRELCRIPSNYRSTESLDAYLGRYHIPGIQRIDTRALTRHLRAKGAMMGILSNEISELDVLKERLDTHPGLQGQDMVRLVTVPDPVSWSEPVSQDWYHETLRPLGNKRYRIAAYDFGIKRNILRILTVLGFQVQLVPASTSAEEIKAFHPDGIFLSNGPGDPEGVGYAVDTVRKLVRVYPVFGICLGHQILALALGAKTYKLKFGHHGSNHPVRCLADGKVEITAQNHNFAVDAASLKGTGLEVTHLNLNDGTVEGMRHRSLPVFSVQYHPEASPGPHDSIYLFRRFYDKMQEARNKKQDARGKMLDK